jgi:RNA polymerase sigma-54 factor
MKQALRSSVKGKLSSTLKNWLPLLQANISDLEERLSEHLSHNPFCKITTNFEKNDEPKDEEESEQHDDNWYTSFERERSSAPSRDFSSNNQSLYEHLEGQITKRLFPTEMSQKIALKIIENIDEAGFYEGDNNIIGAELGIDASEIEKVRKRFCYLIPNGVGAIDVVESYIFQLSDVECSDEVYELAKKMVENLDIVSSYAKSPNFKEAANIIKRLKNPPAIDFIENSQSVIPDIFVYSDSEQMEVRLNDAFYPEIIIENIEGLEKNDFVKPKIKEAKDMIDAINMRKATLNKVGMMIVEYQYEYFNGGAIRPMKLQHLADELGLNISTVSRAISNKYLSSNRGVWPLKSFFSTAITEDTSAAAIKEYMKDIIQSENKLKPLSDEAMLAKVEENFSLKMERRTLTKYRIALNIPSSSERKKLYQVAS